MYGRKFALKPDDGIDSGGGSDNFEAKIANLTDPNCWLALINFELKATRNANNHLTFWCHTRASHFGEYNELTNLWGVVE